MHVSLGEKPNGSPLKEVSNCMVFAIWLIDHTLLNQLLIEPSANHFHILQVLVNSEIFARVLFSRNLAYAKFREIKALAKWHNRSVVY